VTAGVQGAPIRLCAEHRRQFSARGRLCGQDPERRQTRRTASRAASKFELVINPRPPRRSSWRSRHRCWGGRMR